MATYDPRLVAEIEKGLSKDRLSTYVHAASGKVDAALQLYVWNTQVSEALYTPLHYVEVIVRNSFHEQLTQRFGARWFDDPYFKADPAIDRMVDEALSKLSRAGKPATIGRVVAELNFGFWTSLLAKRFETTLWRPALYKAFPSVPKPFLRSTAQATLHNVRELRNRVAHHEPIFARNLSNEHDQLLQLIGWISTDVQNWVRAQSRFNEVFSKRP